MNCKSNRTPSEMENSAGEKKSFSSRKKKGKERSPVQLKTTAVDYGVYPNMHNCDALGVSMSVVLGMLYITTDLKPIPVSRARGQTKAKETVGRAIHHHPACHVHEIKEHTFA